MAHLRGLRSEGGQERGGGEEGVFSGNSCLPMVGNKEGRGGWGLGVRVLGFGFCWLGIVFLHGGVYGESYEGETVLTKRFMVHVEVVVIKDYLDKGRRGRDGMGWDGMM